LTAPIFASVLSILILTAGLVLAAAAAYQPVPGDRAARPSVISGTYPGASPKTIAETSSRRWSSNHGVENAIYTNSSARPMATLPSTSFQAGDNLDTAQVQTQNRVSQAEPRLPEVVRQIGLVTQKRSPDLTMGRLPALRGRALRLAVPAQLRGHPVRDVLARLPGRVTCAYLARATMPCACGSTPPRSPRAT